MPIGDGTSWNETTPGISDFLNKGDDEIRDLRIGTRIRLTKEHKPFGNSSSGGEHVAGSAMAYIQDTNPTTRPGGGVLASPADDGRLGINLFGSSSNLGSLQYYKGGGWFDVQLIPNNFPAGCVPRAAITWGASSPISYLVDSQAAGVEGQGLASGGWRTRRLNTIQSGVALADDTVIHDLSANQFTLSPGTYRLRFWATGYKVDRHICKIQNMTDATVLATGSTERSDTTGSCSSKSIGFVELTLAAEKDFELQHRVETTNNTNGGGIASNVGVAETYCGVEIQRLA